MYLDEASATPACIFRYDRYAPGTGAGSCASGGVRSSVGRNMVLRDFGSYLPHSR